MDGEVSSGNAAGPPSRRRSSHSGEPDSTVTLVSMDGDGFVVEAAAIVVSKLLDAMVDESHGQAKEIPLPNMRSIVVAKVVEFCQHNRTDPMKKIPQPIPNGEGVADHVQGWYAEFVSALGNELLFEVLLAGNYLDLPPLLELCAATVGIRMMNKTPDEIRREFNIREPFSPDVERILREENKWSTEAPIGR